MKSIPSKKGGVQATLDYLTEKRHDAAATKAKKDRASIS